MRSAKTVMITGSSGFVGASLAAKLVSSGFYVVGIDLRDPPSMLTSLVESGFYVHKKLDLGSATTDFYKIFNEANFPDLIIHLAGVTRVKDAALDPVTAIDLNIRATCSLYDSYQKIAALSNKRGGFLFMSTSELATLQNPTITSSIYSVTKQSAEEIIKSLFKPELISTAILRLCTIYGGEMELRTKVPRIFFEKIALDEEICINSIQKINPSFIFIDDAVEMILEIGAALNNSNPGASQASLTTYTAIGEDVSLDSLLRYAEKITKQNVKCKYENLRLDDDPQNIMNNNVDYEYKNIRPKKLTPLYIGLTKLWNIVGNQKNV